MKPSLLILASALISVSLQSVSARQLNLEEAIASAKKECNLPILRDTRTGGSLRLVYTEKNKGISTLYILNRNNGGFIILSADNVGAPVLGYSETGSFDVTDIPDNMKSWLGYYSEDIAHAVENDAPEYQTTPSVKYLPVTPLLKTDWSQLDPYNLQCPVQRGSRCPTGCTATAVAQIIKYHSWPEDFGTGSYSYTWNNAGTINTLSFDYEHTRFEWDKMLDRYENNAYTSEQANAIATLMYAVGVGAKMTYAKEASSATARNAARALIENFNFDKGLNYLNRNYFPIDRWIDMIYRELAEKRPVYYDGFNRAGGTTVGHAFVIDGYDSDYYFHVNWGWGGTSNGYFRLNALDPYIQGTGGSSAGYNDNQGAMFGVRRPLPGSEPTAEFYISGDFMPRLKTYPREGVVNFLAGTSSGMFSLASILPIDNIHPGIRLVAEDNSVTYLWSRYPAATLRPGLGYISLEINAQEFPQSGSYTITPVVQTDKGIVDALVAVGKNNCVKLVATESELIFSPVNTPSLLKITDFKTVGNTYVGKKCTFSAIIINDGAEYQGTITPVIKDTDGSVRATMSALKIDIAGDIQESHQWSETLNPSLTQGTYYIYLLDNEGNEIGEPLQFEILPVPEEPLSVCITDLVFNNLIGENTIDGIKAPATTFDMDIEATFNCTSGLWDAIVRPIVFEVGTVMEKDYAGNETDVYMEAGQTKTYRFKKTLTNVSADKLYYIRFYGRTAKWESAPGYMKNKNGNAAIFYFCLTPSAGIEMIGTEKDCAVTPNPATTTATVTARAAIRAVTIYSMNCSAIRTITFDTTSNEESIDLTSIPAGSYLLKVETAENQFVTRLIKH